MKDQYRTAGNLKARIQLHARFGTNPYGWHRWVFDQLDVPPTARILEVGCGTGALWVENQDRIPAGWDIVLSDLSAGMLDEAKRNLSSVRHAFEYTVADAESLPLDDTSVDAVIANHMLYHVPDPMVALSQIRRVLRRVGLLYAATNGRGHMRELDELLRGLGFEIPSGQGPFKLENGAEQLSAWFPKVEVRVHEDALRVTEVEPLVSYILSMPGLSPTQDQLVGVKRVVEGEIARHGAFYITKSSGILIAQGLAE